MGFRYWRFGEKARHNPQLLLRWSRACREEGFRLLFKGRKNEAVTFFDWALDLRIRHEARANLPVISDEDIPIESILKVVQSEEVPSLLAS